MKNFYKPELVKILNELYPIMDKLSDIIREWEFELPYGKFSVKFNEPCDRTEKK